MLGVNSSPAAGGTGVSWQLSHLMLISPPGTIWIPTGGGWPTAPGTWNWAPWNPDLPQWRLFGRAGIWEPAGQQLLWRPWEALLADLIPSESPAWCRLAPWWFGRVALVQGPTLMQFWGRCWASPQMCNPHLAYQNIPLSGDGISPCPSGSLDCGSYWHWWSLLRVGCDLCQEDGWGCRQLSKGPSCVPHHRKRNLTVFIWVIWQVLEGKYAMRMGTTGQRPTVGMPRTQLLDPGHNSKLSEGVPINPTVWGYQSVDWNSSWKYRRKLPHSWLTVDLPLLM